MVSFDAREPGTTVAQWDADGRLDGLPLFEWEGLGGILVVAAHPDDETLGAGGLLSGASARGLPIEVIVVTGGSPEDDPAVLDERRRELCAALGMLAPEARLRTWSYRDSGTDADRDAIRYDLHTALAEIPADWLVVAPWSGDGHRDHRVVGELVEETASGRPIALYPIWMWHWARPDDDVVPWSRMRGLAIDPSLKVAALAAYGSQVDGDDPLLHPDVLEHFTRPREVFITDALPVEYFEATYARHEDPWGFERRWYEQRKRAATLASLPAERYASGLELGCSIGVLTLQLAGRVDELLAVDVSAAAVERARARIGETARVEQWDLRDGLPVGSWELIVISEVGYYLTREPLRRLLRGAAAALVPGGTIVACHWRHPVRDYPLRGDDVHAELRALGLETLVRHEERDFVLDVLSDDARSVAERTGLA